MKDSAAITELCDYLNELDGVAARAAARYLERHDFTHLKDRIAYEYLSDFGNVRPLREVWARLLRFDVHEFVNFYEGVYRFRKVPHYEDLFMGALISIVTGVIAAELHEQIKSWCKRKKVNQQVYGKFVSNTNVLWDYVLKAFAAREAYYFNVINQEKFINIRDFLKAKIIDKKQSELDASIEEEFTLIWSKFTDRHSLYPIGQTIVELKAHIESEAKHEYESRDIHSANHETYHELSTFAPIRGLGASSGVALGMLKIINSTDDVEKISGLDIGVFRHFSPDDLPCLKKCVGAIGLPGCGGRTGHLALVSRELGIPCVVSCDYYEFADGQFVRLDGYKGEVSLIISIEEIKKLLYVERRLL